MKLFQEAGFFTHASFTKYKKIRRAFIPTLGILLKSAGVKCDANVPILLPMFFQFYPSVLNCSIIFFIPRFSIFTVVCLFVPAFFFVVASWTWTSLIKFRYDNSPVFPDN